MPVENPHVPFVAVAMQRETLAEAKSGGDRLEAQSGGDSLPDWFRPVLGELY